MNAQHTPGPWAFVDHSWCDKSVYASLGQYDEKRICELWLSEYAHEHEDATEKANARLIAAAPELLAALTRLVERDTRGDPVHYSGDHPIAVARAAIARATGGAT